MSDYTKLLHELSEITQSSTSSFMLTKIRQASDAVRELEADRSRLQEALRPFAARRHESYCNVYIGGGSIGYGPGNEIRSSYMLSPESSCNCGVYKAKQALSSTSPPDVAGPEEQELSDEWTHTT